MKKLRSIILDNLGLKLLSIILAALFFMYVKGEQDTVMNMSVRVTARLPEGRMLTGETVDQIRLTVSGKWSKIRDLGSQALQPLEMNLLNHQGDVFYFDEDQFLLPPGLKVVSFHPTSTLVKTVEAFFKEIPVRPVIVGNPEEEVEFMSAVVTPQHISIMGTQEVLEQINFVETIPIELAGRKETASLKVVLVKPDQVQFETAGVDGTTEVDVVLRFKDRIARRAFTLPVKVLGLGVGVGVLYEASPLEVEITLEGSMRHLGTLDPDDLLPFVDAGELKDKDLGTYGVPLMVDELPSGLELVGRKPETVYVTTIEKEVPGPQ